MKNSNFNDKVCRKDRNLNTKILDKASKGMFITGETVEQTEGVEETNLHC